MFHSIYSFLIIEVSFLGMSCLRCIPLSSFFIRGSWMIGSIMPHMHVLFEFVKWCFQFFMSFENKNKIQRMTMWNMEWKDTRFKTGQVTKAWQPRNVKNANSQPVERKKNWAGLGNYLHCKSESTKWWQLVREIMFVFQNSHSKIEIKWGEKIQKTKMFQAHFKWKKW